MNKLKQPHFNLNLVCAGALALGLTILSSTVVSAADQEWPTYGGTHWNERHVNLETNQQTHRQEPRATPGAAARQNPVLHVGEPIGGRRRSVRLRIGWPGPGVRLTHEHEEVELPAQDRPRYQGQPCIRHRRTRVLLEHQPRRGVLQRYRCSWGRSMLPSSRSTPRPANKSGAYWVSRRTRIQAASTATTRLRLPSAT